MDAQAGYEYILIRDATLLVRVRKETRRVSARYPPEFYDMRTGVQLREIYPDLQEIELQRGYRLSEEAASSIMKSGTLTTATPGVDLSKVVAILEVKQRKLDSVVAESILEQVRIIADLLHEFVRVSDSCQKEEKFWLSQQVLALVRKFSGRELSELEEIVEWFKNRPQRR